MASFYYINLHIIDKLVYLKQLFFIERTYEVKRIDIDFFADGF